MRLTFYRRSNATATIVTTEKILGKGGVLTKPSLHFQTQIRDRTSFLVGNRSFGLFMVIGSFGAQASHVPYCLCFQVTRRQGFYPMECRRQSKVIQALFCFRIYQSLCHFSSEPLGWYLSSPNYPLKGVPYRFPPHDSPGIASSPEVFFGSNICGSDIGPPIKSQSQN